jgi:hypothetical protein
MFAACQEQTTNYPVDPGSPQDKLTTIFLSPFGSRVFNRFFFQFRAPGKASDFCIKIISCKTTLCQLRADYFEQRAFGVLIFAIDPV